MKFQKLDKQVIVDSAFSGYSLIRLTAHFEDIVNGFDATMTISDEIKIPNKDNKFDFVEYLDQAIEQHPLFYLQKCESPIEMSFFVYALDTIPELKPQIIVGPYRVDFAVPTKKVIIELDGHDYHKTKEQRTYDAKRDRYLLKQGWQVLRFTGSEIHKDVAKCVDEVKEFLAKKSVKN